MKKIFTVFLLVAVCQNMFAQTDEPINTDRPDQSDGTYILTRHNVQIENGLLFSEGSVLNNFMLRYGLTNSTEVRLLADAGKADDATGLLPIGLSVKQRIMHQKKIIPAITLVGYLRYEKLASSDFSGDGLPASVLIAFQNDINDHISVGYNVGTSTFSDDLNFTVSAGFSLSEKISIFTEYFSHFEKQFKANHNVDAGLLYLINNRFQVDIALGAAIFNTEKAQFLTAGVSYRFKGGSAKNE